MNASATVCLEALAFDSGSKHGKHKSSYQSTYKQSSKRRTHRLLHQRYEQRRQILFRQQKHYEPYGT